MMNQTREKTNSSMVRLRTNLGQPARQKGNGGYASDVHVCASSSEQDKPRMDEMQMMIWMYVGVEIGKTVGKERYTGHGSAKRVARLCFVFLPLISFLSFVIFFFSFCGRFIFLFFFSSGEGQ
jgi:hypothetical protein